MIIVLKREASEAAAQEILARIEEKGLKPLYMPGTERVVLGALGDERVLAELALDGHPMVESLKPILSPYKLVSREMHPHDTIVKFGAATIGGRGFAVIAGPCAVETEERLRSQLRSGEGGGRDRTARRRLQAPHQPLFLPGPWAGRAAASCARSATSSACRSSPK